MPGALSEPDILIRRHPVTRLGAMATSRVLLIALAVVLGVVALYFAAQAAFEAEGKKPGRGQGEPVTVVTTP
jgi:hypothetical protein